jgi:diaminopimelate decarboxylase
VLRLLEAEGLSLDVCSAGELAVARSVGFLAARILSHSTVKTGEDLKAAIGYGVGRIVLDSLDELDQVTALARPGQAVLLRVTPEVDAHTHRAIATGVEDQKFGFSLASGAVLDAIGRVLAAPGLTFIGLHCHVGSHVRRRRWRDERQPAARAVRRPVHRAPRRPAVDGSLLAVPGTGAYHHALASN